MRRTLGKALSAAREWFDNPSHRTNAPIDPFGAGDGSAAQLSEEFMILRASDLVDCDGPFRRHQDLQREQPDAFFSSMYPPDLVLFVSHRWQATAHPDPSGEQAAAVRSFLRVLLDVARSAGDEPGRRAERVPSLRVHGVFQAANLLGSGDMTLPEQPWADRLRRARTLTELGDDVLAHVGVWYDFSCLPQGDALSRKPRTEEEQQIVNNALGRMHMLIAASNVLVLRTGGDDYANRAWCVAELSIGQPGFRHFVLRTDLLGEAIGEAELVESEGDPDLSCLRNIDAHWTSGENGWGVLRAMSTAIFFGLGLLEAKREVPLLVTGDAPNIFPGHRALLVAMFKEQATLDQVDRMLGDGRLEADVAELVTRALDRADLHCSEPADRLYLGLLMLHARHVGAPEMAQFYASCLKRSLEGKTLRLVRYREKRTDRDLRVWWVFADEPGDSPARRIPKWAADATSMDA